MKSINTLKEKMKEYQRKWYVQKCEDPFYKIYRKSKLDEWRINSPKQRLYQIVKSRAKTQGITFSIVPEDIIYPKECPILKVPFEFKTRYAASVDRIDPTKGYIKDNIQVISKKANMMKQDASPDELRNFAQWALNQYQL